MRKGGVPSKDVQGTVRVGRLWARVKQGVAETATVVKAIFDEITGTVISKIKQLFKWLTAAGKSTVDAILELKKDIIDTGKGAVKDLFYAIKEQMGDSCQAIKDLKAAGITQSSLATALFGVGDLGSSIKCSKWTDIPFTEKRLCVGIDFDADLCTKTATLPSVSHPSCTCEKKAICVKYMGCLPFKAPTSCSCCDKWKTFAFVVPYCDRLKTTTYGPWTYCKKFW